MAYKKSNANGQGTMANSEPVVIASDQSAVPVSGTVTSNLSATDNAVLDAIQVGTDKIIAAPATAAKQLADGHTVALSATDNAVLDTIDTALDAINAKLVTGTVIGDVNLGATDNAVLDTIAAKDFATQTTLALVKAKTDNIPVLGQALAAASVPVILPSATVTTLTPPAAITGFATETTLGTVHGHVDSIDTKTPALGQALAAASTPVVLTAAQMTTLTPPAQGLTDTQLRATAVPISVATIPSHAVTNANIDIIAGAVAATHMQADVLTVPALIAGTAIIGKVGIDQTTPGTTNLVALAANQSVNNAQINGVAPLMGAGNTGTGSQRVTIASDQAAVASKAASGSYASGCFASGSHASGAFASGAIASGALASGSIATGAIVDALADDAAFTVGSSRTFPSGLLADETSTDSVDEGDVGTPRMTLDRKQIVVLSPHATGESLDTFFSIDLDETEEDVKATAGKIYGYYIFNAAATTQYVRFYNATAANTTVGTTAAIIVIPVPAGAAANCSFPQGIGFSTALCAAATTGVAANDTGAPATNSIVIDVFYK